MLHSQMLKNEGKKLQKVLFFVVIFTFLLEIIASVIFSISLQWINVQYLLCQYK